MKSMGQGKHQFEGLRGQLGPDQLKEVAEISRVMVREDEFYSSCTEEPMESFKHMVDL